MSMYQRTQERHDEIMARHESESKGAGPELLHYNFSHHGTPPTRTFAVHFNYDNCIKTFDGKQWY